jgi:phage gp29-like protein
MERRAHVGLEYEVPNTTTGITVSAVQSMLRAAESGDTRRLFGLYRDLAASGTHVQAEFAKRKLALLSQPMTLIPADRTNADDLAAVEACKALVAHCENWNDALVHLMDACLWPLAVAERIYEPAAGRVVRAARANEVRAARANEVNLQYVLKKVSPVDATLLCFRLPQEKKRDLAALESDWEGHIRVYNTDVEGRVLVNSEQTYGLDRNRHIVHRGHLLVGQRDNWGGPMRAVVFWWFLGSLARDWFARGMERYASPFPVGHTNSKDQQSVKLLQDAFAESVKIGGLVVDHETQVELAEIASSGMADAYEKFLNVCNREVSKVIVGQTLSAEAQSTGLGSSVGKLHSDVREDIRQWDQVKTSEMVEKQIFEPFLRVNGLRGRAPKPAWGGLSEEQAKQFAETLNVLKQGGFEPTDEAIPTVSERLGFPVRRQVAPVAPAGQMQAGSAEQGNGISRRDAEVRAARANGEEAGSTEEEQEGEEEEARGVRGLRAELSPRVRARIAAHSAQARMADELGVPASWLNPVRDFLEELQSKANDARLSDEDLLDFLDQAVKRVPELFADMDVDAIAKVLEAGMGTAVMGEVRRSLRTATSRTATSETATEA